MSEPEPAHASQAPTNPFIGFGRVGWIGLVVFGLLALVPIVGIDPIYQLYYWLLFEREVDVTRGADGSNYASIHRAVWALSALYRPWMDFRPPSMAIMIAILIWSPLSRSRTRAIIAMLVFLSLAHAVVEISNYYWRSTYLFGEIRTGPFWIWVEPALVHALVVIGVTAALWNATRSAWLARSVFALGLLGFTFQLGPVIWNHPLWHWIEFRYHDIYVGPDLIWHAALMGTMLTWAIREHRRAPHCPHCDYDIAGLSSPVCPECGEDLAQTRTSDS